MRYQLDDLIIDTSQKQVFRFGKRLAISGLNYDFLAWLVTHPAEVIEFDELIEGIWAPAVVSHDTVTQRVTLLRNVLGDNGRDPRYIRSVRGRGYQLVSTPAVLDSPVAEPAGFRHKVVTVLGTGIIAMSLWGAWVMGAFNPDVQPVATVAIEPVDRLLQRAQHYHSIGQKDDNERAIELFRRVLQIDPAHTEARLGLSKAYTRSMCRYNADPVWAERAEELAASLIQEQPDNFRAWRVLGFSHDCRGHIASARNAYHQAIRLDPNNDIKSQSALAYLQGETGELAQSLSRNLFVSESDPEQTFALIQLGRSYELLGLHTQAESVYSQSFELYPDNIYSNMGYPWNLFYQGRFDEARDIVTVARKRPMHPDLLLLSAELAMLNGDKELARDELAAAVSMRPTALYLKLMNNLQQPEMESNEWAHDMLVELNDPSHAQHPKNGLKRALLHQHLGQHDAALTSLNEAVDLGYRNASYLSVSPLFDSLRQHDGFQDVLSRIQNEVDLQLVRVHELGLLDRAVTLR